MLRVHLLTPTDYGRSQLIKHHRPRGTGQKIAFAVSVAEISVWRNQMEAHYTPNLGVRASWRRQSPPPAMRLPDSDGSHTHTSTHRLRAILQRKKCALIRSKTRALL